MVAGPTRNAEDEKPPPPEPEAPVQQPAPEPELPVRPRPQLPPAVPVIEAGRVPGRHVRRTLRRRRLGELRSAAVETWGFIWIMLILKIPLVMLLYTVWWAIKQVPDPAVDDSTDGGSGDRTPPPEPQPRTPRRRGPHGEPTPPAPPRTRTKVRSRDRTVK